MKKTMIASLIILQTFAAFAQQYQQPGFGSSASCSTSSRKALCWDMSTDPSGYREIEINGCSVNCSAPSQPICNPGTLYGSNCTDGVNPAMCYCN